MQVAGRELRVGSIVHLIKQERCYAAIVTSLDDNGTLLHPFGVMGVSQPSDDWHPYNSLSSARPTSGWHWPEEHDPQGGPPATAEELSLE